MERRRSASHDVTGSHTSTIVPYRCPVVASTIQGHQWEVAAETSVVSCVLGHTHQLVRWRHGRDDKAKAVHRPTSQRIPTKAGGWQGDSPEVGLNSPQ